MFMEHIRKESKVVERVNLGKLLLQGRGGCLCVHAFTNKC